MSTFAMFSQKLLSIGQVSLKTEEMDNINNQLFTLVTNVLMEAREDTIRAVNRAMLEAYFQIGRLIVEDEQQGEKRAQYGKGTLKELSKRLTLEFGKSFSVQNLENMRKFYQIYTLSGKSQSLIRISDKPNATLSWTHYLILIRIEDEEERSFYEIEALNCDWSVRELKRQLNSALYQRLALSRDQQMVMALAQKGQIIENPKDVLKEPYILEFLGFPEKYSYSENELEQEIINKLEHFLLELGKGFTFVGRQVRFTFDEKHFRVDLVFYNRLLQCFVLLDLKIGEITHQYLGQMQMYVNYYDRFVKTETENKTVGIILCKEKNDTLVEITLPEDNKHIFASRYQTILPSKEQLIKLLRNKSDK